MDTAAGARKPGFASNLTGKLMSGLGLGLLLASLAFLVVFIGGYRERLAAERGLASEQVNRLLQVALQNAMLKRDLPGLREIVAKLGNEPGIARVLIVNPQHEVRFASAEPALGAKLTLAELGCETCKADLSNLPGSTRLIRDGNGHDVLRSVNPIRNQAECQGCHGEIAASPVNGVLVVDHSAESLKADALSAAAQMTGAGAAIVALAMLGVWSFMHKTVVQPVQALQSASHALAAGDLSAQIDTPPASGDEIAGLCRSFNDMAGSLAASHAKLREHETFLQAVIDTVPDAVRVIDESYNVVLINQAYSRQLGDEPSNLIGVPCYKARGRTEPCPATLFTCPFHALDANTPQVRFMHELHRRDGSTLTAELTASRLTTLQNGTPRTLVIEAMRDLDQQIKFSHEQRLSEIGQLATGVAHEIYNPLSSVRLGLQALDKRLTAIANGDAEAADYLTIVNGQIDRCIEVTRRLLDLGSPPSSSVQLVSFTRIVPEVISLLRYDAEQLGVAIDIDLGREDLRLFATDSELRMLLLNLVQNAFHAMPKGGKLTITGHIADGKVLINVADTGVGIPAPDLVRIFDPFFTKRADGSEGSGLGLAICRAITGRYHGSLEVASTPGQGTLFTIRMPVAGLTEDAA